jgi:hypothetical protein
MMAMSRRSLLVFLAMIAPPATGAFMSASGCGDTVNIDDDDDDASTGGDGGSGSGGRDGGGTAGKLDGGKDALPDYVDPGCPDGGGSPIYMFSCDPYEQFNGDCLPGEGCFIFVDYPIEPCGPETYGSFCAPPGFGGQGDSCGGGFDCQAGFVCVVTGAGTQCVELCSLTGDDGCAAGLVCEPIDVEGFGGCL